MQEFQKVAEKERCGFVRSTTASECFGRQILGTCRSVSNSLITAGDGESCPATGGTGISDNLSDIRPRNNSIRVSVLRSGRPAQAARVGYLSWKTLRVLLLVCLTLLGPSLALTSQEESHHATDHCCLLCHVGPLPFVQTTVSATVMPVFSVAWLLPTPDFELAHSPFLFASSSRGPPA